MLGKGPPHLDPLPMTVYLLYQEGLAVQLPLALHHQTRRLSNIIMLRFFNV